MKKGEEGFHPKRWKYWNVEIPNLKLGSDGRSKARKFINLPPVTKKKKKQKGRRKVAKKENSTPQVVYVLCFNQKESNLYSILYFSSSDSAFYPFTYNSPQRKPYLSVGNLNSKYKLWGWKKRSNWFMASKTNHFNCDSAHTQFSH